MICNHNAIKPCQKSYIIHCQLIVESTNKKECKVSLQLYNRHSTTIIRIKKLHYLHIIRIR